MPTVSALRYYHDDDDATSPPPRRSLPALHDVLGDVLQQSPTSRTYPSSRDRYSSYTYPQDTRSKPSLHQQQHYHSHHHSSGGGGSPPAPRRAEIISAPDGPQHAYHLFNYSPGVGLVHQRTSTQEQDLEPAQPRPRLPPSDPSRKYVCDNCGNRFSKQSTLRNHLLTHSGEKPHECGHPGCGRRFSMACNMQRHMRTHTSASAFVIEDEDEPSGGRGHPTSSSHARSASHAYAHGDRHVTSPTAPSTRASSWDDAASSRGPSPSRHEPPSASYYHRR